MPPKRKKPPKKATSSSEQQDDDASSTTKSRLRQELDSLHQEMEIAQYGVTETGQLRKKLPRRQFTERRQKRKLLESQDAIELAQLAPETTRRRLRGSRAAIEDHVIQGSLVFGSPTQPAEEKDDEEEEVEEDEEEQEELPEEAEAVIKEVEEVQRDEDAEEVDEDDAEDEDEDYSQDEDANDEVEEEEETPKKKVHKPAKAPRAAATIKKKAAPRKPATSSTPSRSRKRRRLFRLRNFKSQRMAQRHGDALAAHARGLPKLAIQKLKQVAKDAPSAPQVYSSLGMVYEDMLLESRRKQAESSRNAGVENEDAAAQLGSPEGNKDTGVAAGNESGESRPLDDDKDADEAVPDKFLAEQLELAKKAYGSYHVAAILCRQDYSLWLRAADSASEIAGLHDAIKGIPDLAPHVRSFHRSEKQRWLSEAKNDYQKADNLKPSGIDVPCKLASVLIDLGHLSEALTLLTDLKNSRDFADTRYEFESSYKAWLLYADLMLRVGYECRRWNDGFQKNENHMFRRWLRKHSETFDWQERRLQALAKALEAAAGSHNCVKVTSWMEQRASTGHSDTDNHGDKIGDEGFDAVTTSETERHFEEEKELLKRENWQELEAFDKTTEDMPLEPSSVAARERKKARDELVEKQSAAMRGFEKDFYGKQSSNSQSDQKESGNSLAASSSSKARLMLSASVKTVCSIASQLMRHMIGIGLFKAGRLVGEAVSQYLKERAVIRDKRVEARRKFEEAQSKPTSIFALQHETYDEMDDQSDADASDIALSDDDEFEESIGHEFMRTLRKGTLPPELRVLYGLCLIGEGGRKFLATLCLESIKTLEQEPPSWLNADDDGVDEGEDSNWLGFQEEMTKPLGRTAAYALVADGLKASEREKLVSDRVAKLFGGQIVILRTNGLLDEMINLQLSRSTLANRRKRLVVKVLVASARFEALEAESLLSIHDGDMEPAENMLVSSVRSLSQLLPLQWRVESDGSIPLVCLDILNTLARDLSLLSRLASSSESRRRASRAEILELFLYPVSLVCGKPNADLLNPGQKNVTTELKSVPFPAEWLSLEQKLLSLRTFNLCVATNVASFSGWESEEFTTRLMRRRDTRDFYGITASEGQVAGYLPASVEEELSRQWNLVDSMIPATSSLNFDALLSSLRKTPWYIESKERNENARDVFEIASFGESDGLSILLDFSRMCLLLAQESDAGPRREQLLLNSLSILLPLSQFALNHKLWQSDIGTAAVSYERSQLSWRKDSAGRVESIDEKNGEFPPPDSSYDVHARQDYSSVQPRPPPPANARRSPAPDPRSKVRHARSRKRPGNYKVASAAPQIVSTDKEIGEWFDVEDYESPLSNLVNVACSDLQAMWNTLGDRNESIVSSEAAAQAMEKLSTSMQLLRKCYTEQAVEKAALQVAAALIQVASCKGCTCIFSCLQQAATFAGQASKRSASDEPFKCPLPALEACTPLDALLILGRADCLQSVYFFSEAAFLCNFVAHVCSFHRDNRKTDLEWNIRWKIVAVVAYNVSVLIRNAVATENHEQDKPLDNTSFMWECDCVEELKRGRADGLTWSASMGVVEDAVGEEDVRPKMDRNTPATQDRRAALYVNDGAAEPFCGLDSACKDASQQMEAPGIEKVSMEPTMGSQTLNEDKDSDVEVVPV